MKILKVKKQIITIVSVMFIMLVISSCGAKKSGCGLTSDVNQPVKGTKIICDISNNDITENEF